MTVIYFVRHGESEANVGNWLAAHMDAPLTSLGKQQAEQSARMLSHVVFETIYSSDLSRAMQTAYAHAAKRGCAVVPTEQLREFDAGDLTGMMYDDIALKYPSLYPKLWRESFGAFEPPGGESLPCAAERMERCVQQIARDHDGQTLLFVTHAGILRAFWGRILGIAPSETAHILPFCANASYSVLEVEEGKIRPICYGVTEGVSEFHGTKKP